MRRVVSPLRGEARPRKRFCPPRTRSPHLNLSQPPFEAWCADPIHPHFHSGWQLGDAFVFPPLQPVHSPPASRMLGDIAVSLLQCTEPVPASPPSHLIRLQVLRSCLFEPTVCCWFIIGPDRQRFQLGVFGITFPKRSTQCRVTYERERLGLLA